MALTTNAKVWRMMAAIFLSLSMAFAVLFYLMDIFIVLVIGVLLILVTERAGKDFNKRMDEFGYPRWKRNAYMYGQLFFWAFTFFLFIGGQMMEMANLLIEVESHRNLGASLLAGYGKYVPPALSDRLITRENVKTAMDYSISSLSALISKAFFYGFTGLLVIPLMFTTYFRDRDRIMKAVYDSVPRKFQKGFAKATRDIGVQLNDFLTAKLMEGVIVGGICCLGFYIAGVKGWLVLGVFAGIMNVIPYIGPLIGAIPPVFIGYLDSPLTAVLALSTVAVAHIIDNFYIYPCVIPNKVKIDSLWSILLILIGAHLIGIYGMLFALPVYLIYKVVLINTYEELITIYPEN